LTAAIDIDEKTGKSKDSKYLEIRKAKLKNNTLGKDKY
jgi:hypothetical protein